MILKASHRVTDRSVQEMGAERASWAGKPKGKKQCAQGTPRRSAGLSRYLFVDEEKLKAKKEIKL